MSAFATVDDYIAAQPAAAQPRLRELRAAIRAALPDAAEVISYGLPTYKLHGRSAAYFGAAKDHCALYGIPEAAFGNELATYHTSGRGTVRFPLDKPIPKTLVRKLVLARAAKYAARR